jgi:hypothetical protein
VFYHLHLFFPVDLGIKQCVESFLKYFVQQHLCMTIGGINSFDFGG